MALTLNLKQWLALSILSCAAIWFGLLHHTALHNAPARPSQPAPDPGTFGLTWTLDRQLKGAADRLRILQLRDSVLEIVASKPAAQISVVLDSALPATTRHAVDSLVRQKWNTLDIEHGAPVTIGIVIDTQRTVRAVPRARGVGGIPIAIFLPSAATGGRCVVIGDLTSPLWGPANQLRPIMLRNLATPETINSLLSPCVYFAAFGQPGALVEQWLTSGHWDSARLADWTQPATPWRVSDVEGVRYGFDLAAGLTSPTDPSWQIRRYIAPSGIACLAGRRDACADIVLQGWSNSDDSVWRRNVIASTGTDLSAFYNRFGPTPLGPAKGTMLAEMVRTLGRERFAQFWQSPLPVTAAFAAASGTTLNDWARDWARRMYGDAAVGPAISTAGLATGALIVAFGLGLAVAVERRRGVA